MSHLQVAVATLKSWRTISSVLEAELVTVHFLSIVSLLASLNIPPSEKKNHIPYFPSYFPVLLLMSLRTVSSSLKFNALFTKLPFVGSETQSHPLSVTKERRKRENGKCEDVCPPSALDRSSGSRGEGERLCGATAALLHVGGEEMMK